MTQNAERFEAGEDLWELGAQRGRKSGSSAVCQQRAAGRQGKAGKAFTLGGGPCWHIDKQKMGDVGWYMAI